MAVLALAAVGSMVGGAIGGTFLGVTAASWGFAIGSFIGNALFPPKSPDQHNEGPRYADLKIIASEYGRAIPIIYGSYPLAGNIIWSSEVREVATTSSQEVGGKGGGGQTVTNTTYAYYADFAVLLGEGEMAGVRKIKFNGELKYNVADSATSETIVASSLNAREVRFYPGDETQTADPLISAAEGNYAPAYRGYAYIVFENFDLTPYGGKMPQLEFEAVRNGSEATTNAVGAGTIATTTTVVTTTRPQPDNVGDIFYVGAVSNTAVRVSYYSKAVKTVYSRALWGFLLPRQDLHPSGKVVYNNYGGYFGFFEEDGTVTEFTGAPGILGSSGICWKSSNEGYAQGDGSSGFNVHRFVLNSDAMTVDEVLLTGARSSTFFKNGCGISGRLYTYGATTYNHEIAYLTSDNTRVILISGTAYSSLGQLISRDGYLWLSPTTGGIEKRDANGTLLASVSLPGSAVSIEVFEANDGYIWVYTGSGAMYAIHPTLLTVSKTTTSVGTRVPLGFTSDNRLIFSQVSGSNILLSEVEPLPRLTSSSIFADDIVSDILSRVGLESADIELSAISGDVVRGYGVGRRMSARAALEPILAVTKSMLVETDNLLKAVKRSSTIAMTIDEEDLGARQYGSEPIASISESRGLETDLPRQVNVEYMDEDAGYEVGNQYARRLVGNAFEPETVPFGVVMTANEAQALAETLLYDRWVSRMRYQVSLPRKYSRLDPGDNINIPSIGALRIVERKDADGVLSLSCVANEGSVLSSIGAGASLPSVSDVVSQSGPTLIRFLDIPLLRDIDDGIGFYLAVSGYYDGWNGAELWRSSDGGSSYTRTGLAMMNASIMGSAITALANYPGGNTFDEHNSVDVQLVLTSSTLSSATVAQVFAGSNAALLGGEIIQFKTATQLSAGRYRLSGLLRGQRGTEQYMSTHIVGDSFVPLDPSKLYRVTHGADEIGAERLYKAPSVGQLLSDAAPVAFTSQAVSQKPLSPVRFRAGRTAAASWDIIGGWTRRARIGPEWRDYSDASLGEATEAYEMEIWTSGFAALKRTLTSTATGAGSVITPSTQSFAYKSADQVTDFGSNQSTIYYRVYQLSDTVGRGFVLQGTITL